MGSRAIPSAFVKSVLQNGVGRHVCQLQRITLNFCKSRADSIGMRDFIENHLLDFTKENPGVVVYLQPRRHRAPKLVAEYLNGNRIDIPTRTFSDDEICQWIGHLRTRSGHDIVRLRKQWHTDSPSIQGIWTPFTNKDTKLNITEFPSEEFRFVESEKSASEKLLERAKELRSANLVQITDSKEQNVAKS